MDINFSHFLHSVVYQVMVYYNTQYIMCNVSPIISNSAGRESMKEKINLTGLC